MRLSGSRLQPAAAGQNKTNRFEEREEQAERRGGEKMREYETGLEGGV